MVALLIAPASAAPVGDPVPLPSMGRVRVDVRGSTGTIQETDGRCEESSGCGADWQHTALTGGLHLALFKGVGVYGEFGLGQERIQAADYRGQGRIWAAGVRAAVPLGKHFWLAANARADRGEAESLVSSDDPEVSSYEIYTGSLVGVIGDAEDGVSIWAGAQSSWYWSHSVWPLGTKRDELFLKVPLSPDRPVSGVMGVGLTSEPLGLPWRRTGRLTIGLEGLVGQEYGASASLGIAL